MTRARFAQTPPPRRVHLHHSHTFTTACSTAPQATPAFTPCSSQDDTSVSHPALCTSFAFELAPFNMPRRPCISACTQYINIRPNPSPALTQLSSYSNAIHMYPPARILTSSSPASASTMETEHGRV
ncbi:hypothetical protein BDR03DRAFT_353933 [Suillus americanus]|nr:hypothetical protein BDR03DRAFT_353933 [Suillus americanus]